LTVRVAAVGHDRLQISTLSSFVALARSIVVMEVPFT